MCSAPISWLERLYIGRKGGSLEVSIVCYVDYRTLNKVIRKNRLALPLISEILDRLTRACHLTKLDLKVASPHPYYGKRPLEDCVPYALRSL